MQLEKHISDLLYRYQCVTIPGFGAFLTNYKSAVVNADTNSFYPPSKQVSFNSQLTSNDGLLASYVSEADAISYEAALILIADSVKSWRNSINKLKSLTLNNIGEFSLNEEGNMLFQPSTQINYFTASFGLSSFVSPQINREVYKKEVAVLEEETPILFTPEKRASRPYLKYAAIALIAVTLGGVGFKEFDKRQQKNQLIVEQQAQQTVEDSIQSATFFDASPAVLPAISLNVTRAKDKYFVVAGAFRFEANANRKVNQLKASGYDAKIIGINKFGLHQVSYAGFVDKGEALSNLRTIKRTVTRDAWLLVKN